MKRGKGRTGSKFITRLKRCTVYARDGECCVYCTCKVQIAKQVGARARCKRAATIDHVRPGGGNGYDNLVTACWRCNHTKADRVDAWHDSVARRSCRNRIMPWMRERARVLRDRYYPEQVRGKADARRDKRKRKRVK